MGQYRSGGSCAAIAGAAMLLSLGAIPAQAQAPGGSYLQSCTNIRAFGDRVIADCRRADGGWDRTALRDLNSCVGDIANQNGRLICARGGPSYGWSGYQRWQGYGSSYAPNTYGGYAPNYNGGSYGYGR